MKWLKVFALFIMLHVVGWVGAHWYKSKNPQKVLVVADTSFALKTQYPNMQSWIKNYAGDSRYRQIIIGTDKATMGDFSDIKSIESIFRVSFGRSDSSSLKRYDSLTVDKRIFLSDGEFKVPGWTIVTFP